MPHNQVIRNNRQCLHAVIAWFSIDIKSVYTIQPVVTPLLNSYLLTYLLTIHQRHRQTGQTDRHDRQRSDSIVRTVLQTVTQKRSAAPAQKPQMNVQISCQSSIYYRKLTCEMVNRTSSVRVRSVGGLKSNVKFSWS